MLCLLLITKLQLIIGIRVLRFWPYAIIPAQNRTEKKKEDRLTTSATPLAVIWKELANGMRLRLLKSSS